MLVDQAEALSCLVRVLSAAVQCSSTHSVNAARSNIPLCPTQAERQFPPIKAGGKTRLLVWTSSYPVVAQGYGYKPGTALQGLQINSELTTVQTEVLAESSVTR